MTPDRAAWDRAVTALLRDRDVYTDWICGECSGREPIPSNVERLVRYIATGRMADALGCDVVDINHVMLTAPDWDIFTAARDLLRQRFGAAHSEQVMAACWAEQDRDEAEATADWVGSLDLRRADGGHIGSEFEGTLR